MRKRPLRNLASISALAAACCAGCGGPASGPLPPPKTTAAAPSPAAATIRLSPLEVSTETPMVADVIRTINAAREEGGRPALRVSHELQEVAKAQVQAQVDAQPETSMSRGRQAKREKSKPMPVAERAAKLGHPYRDLKEITVPADGPVVTVLAGYLRDPKNDYRKIALGDCTEFAAAEGCDPKGLPHLSVVFGTPEPVGGEGKGAAKGSK